MQFGFNSTSSNVFLTALIVLLTWTSFAQGAAINRDILPARRDFSEEARAPGANVANNDLLRRDGIKFSTTEPEGQPLIGRERDRAGGFVDGSYNVAARTAEENEEIPVDDDGHLSRRWYTLVEIAEAEEGE